jgi:hypothetical protein
MLLDIVATYDNTTKETLRNLWKECIQGLAKDHDPRKILSFLNKCAII